MVAGSFNGWSRSANVLLENAGVWQARVPEARPGDEYKLVFDGDTWRTDPRARGQSSAVGNSIVVEPDAYDWNDSGWETPSFADMIIYELHVGSFSGDAEGGKRGLGRRLSVCRDGSIGRADALVSPSVSGSNDGGANVRHGETMMKHVSRSTSLAAALLFGLGPSLTEAAEPPGPAAPRGASVSQGRSRAAEPAGFKVPVLWEYSAPLITPEKRDKDRSRAQKDPTLVFYGGRWHVFMTVKLPGRSAIEYCSFERWEDADSSPRTILEISDSDYYCAPQVFYFTPHEKWYLIYQMGVPGADKMWVAHSTTRDIADPRSWTRAAPILDGGRDDPRKVGGLDYWIVCDERRAYLFLTSLNGKMWRLWTRLEDFPAGFGRCELALEAQVFEASHTYKLKGTGKYLTVIEENGRRYYKAYLADRLDGEWTPIADTADHPFAGWKNIRPAPGVAAWTDNISHGELVRDGYDQTLTVDPGKLRFVFQGMLDKHKAGRGYGRFQWRIGMLTPVASGGPGDNEDGER